MFATCFCCNGPGPGQIRDSNRAMLLAAAEATGAVTKDLGIALDTKVQRTHHRAAIRAHMLRRLGSCTAAVRPN